MEWTIENTLLLDALLDQLIPANDEKEIPAAGTLGLGSFIEQGEIANLNKLLATAESAAGGMTPDLVRHLESKFPRVFQDLLKRTYMGYYSRPDVRTSLKIGAHPVHPKGYDVASDSKDLLETLTAPVRQRGQVFRDA